MADRNRSGSRRRRTLHSTADPGHPSSHRDPIRTSSQTKRGSSSSPYPARPDSAADAYRKRLREARREVSEAAERDEATASFGTKSAPSNGFGPTTVHPPARVDPAKIKDNGQYAYNGESWWLVERVFAARDQPENGSIQRNIEKLPARREVLVKWVGWPKPTWEPLRNLRGKDALASFEDLHGNAEVNAGPAAVYERWFKY